MFIKRDISAILLNVEEQVMYEVEFPGLVNVMMEYLLRRAEAESPSYNNRLRTKIILQGYIAELRA